MTSRHDLALLRLAAQRLVGPPLATPGATVTWLGAVQAQDLPGALESVALRTAGRSTDDVRAAFDGGHVVRTWPMRGTLHAVPAADAGWMVDLMTARPRAAAARRRVQLGLTDDDVALARRTLTAALEGGRAVTRAEALALWSDAGLSVAGGPGYHLLAHLAQTGVLCLGPMAGAKEQAFVLLDEWVPAPRRPERDEALATVAERFLRSHGPATVHDLARWTGLPLGDVRRGVAAVDGLTTLDVDGETYHLDPQTPAVLDGARDAARAVHLLPGFDELVLGYRDRSVTVPPEHADRVVPGGNGVFQRTVVHDGVAVATWRAVGGGTRRRLQVEPFDALPDDVLQAAQDRFTAFP